MEPLVTSYETIVLALYKPNLVFIMTINQTISKFVVASFAVNVIIGETSGWERLLFQCPAKTFYLSEVIFVDILPTFTFYRLNSSPEFLHVDFR